MTQVSGVDLLEIAPNLGDARTSTVDRPADHCESPTGVVLETTTGLPSTTHALSWGCATRADLDALEDVLDARKGRLVPLWAPTYQRDVTVLTSTLTTWIVTKRDDGGDIGSLVASLPHWQWWIARAPGGGSYRVFHFTSVTDNMDGTETWNGTIQAGSGPVTLTTADHGVFSRLVYCRMASDSYRVEYRGKASVVTASFVEVAAEAP